MRKFFRSVWDKIYDDLFLDFYLGKEWTWRFKLMNFISGDLLREFVTYVRLYLGGVDYYHKLNNEQGNKCPAEFYAMRAKRLTDSAFNTWCKRNTKKYCKEMQKGECMRLYIFVGTLGSPESPRKIINTTIANVETPSEIEEIEQRVKAEFAKESNENLVFGGCLLGTELLPQDAENDFTLIDEYHKHEFDNALALIEMFGWQTTEKIYSGGLKLWN